MNDPTPLFAGLALAALMHGEDETARYHLRQIPRSERGRVKIALDDLDMILSRVGRGNASTVD